MSIAKQYYSSASQTSHQSSSTVSKARKSHSHSSHSIPAFLQAKLKSTSNDASAELESEAHELSSVAQLKLKVGESNDRYEKEADAVASSVLSGQTATHSISSVNSQQKSASENINDNTENNIRKTTSSTPLPESVRQQIEPVLGHSLEDVRVVESTQARQTVDSLGAKAFTHGNVIWLGQGQSKNDTGLMAHEATHVIQQTHSSSHLKNQSKAQSQALAPSEQLSAHSSQQKSLAPVQKSPSNGIVQRFGWSDVKRNAGKAWNATGGKVIEVAADTGAKIFWGTINRVAPDFAPVLKDIQQQGILNYLYQRLKQGVTGFFTALGVAPTTISRIFSVFEAMGGQLSEILVALPNLVCGPLFKALKQLKTILSKMAGDAWNSITEFFSPVKKVLSKIHSKIIAPVIDLLGSTSSKVFQSLKKLSSKLWSWTSPIRKASSKAWNWVKESLGMGSSSDSGSNKSSSGENGISAWITGKLSSAWNKVKEEIKPITEPVQKTISKIQEVLPLDAIVELKNKVIGWMGQVTSLSDNMEKPNGVTKNQVSLREAILPALLAHISGLQIKLVLAGLLISTKISALLGHVQSFIGSLSRIPLLSFVKNNLAWLVTSLVKLNGWASTTVLFIFMTASLALGQLAQFIQHILSVLYKLANIVKNVATHLADLVTGTLFAIIPKCILIPVKNFIKNQILSRIPIFSQLFALPDVWVKVKSTAMQILRQVFVHGNLAKAAWTFFSAILSIFNIPAALIKGILKNAASAIGNILRNPVSFLLNLLRTIKAGFGLFFKNIFKHLIGGVSKWLFGTLSKSGITPPEDFSFKSILGVVMQILDITKERIFTRLKDQIGQPAVDKLKKRMELATGAWEWFSALVTKGPGGLWKMLKEKLTGLWDTVLDGLVSWLQTNIITRISYKLLSMLDPSGIMAVVNSIIALYKAIESFMAYLRQMLEIVGQIFSGIAGIAKGAITQAAGFLEGAMARSIPVIIGFLANQLSLGNLASKIQQMVQGVRKIVDKAIDWLIKKALRLGRGVINVLKKGGSIIKAGAKKGIQSIKKWWKGESVFTAKNGEKHRLYIKGKSGSAKLMMASTPTPYMNFINTLDTSNSDSAEKIAKAKIIAAQLDVLIKQNANESSKDKIIDGSIKIQNKLDQLAEITAPMVKADPGKEPLQGDNKPANISSRSSVTHGTQSLSSNTVGMTMTADFLGPNHPKGSATKGNQPSLMSKLITSPKRYNNGKFIRGHLLNHELGGPGEDKNLFPITAEANKNHNIYVEEPLKQLVNNDKFWVFYSVNVKVSEIMLDNSVQGKNHIKAQFMCKANKITEDGSHLPGSIIKKSSIESNYVEDTRDITDETSSQELVTMSDASADTIGSLDGINSSEAQQIKNNQPYSNWAKLMMVLKTPEEKQQELQRQIKNTQGKKVQLWSKKGA